MRRDFPYQAGDIVFLRSGGPNMTVCWQKSNVVTCQWFVDRELREAEFHVDMLEDASA